MKEETTPAQAEGRGFAAMDGNRQREIASKGGTAAHEKGTAHEFDAEEARAAGRKGGEAVSQNREHMAAIGRKGGERVARNREYMAQIGRKGGERVGRHREHMAQIARKGGEACVKKHRPARAAARDSVLQNSGGEGSVLPARGNEPLSGLPGGSRSVSGELARPTPSAASCAGIAAEGAAEGFEGHEEGPQ